MAPVFPKTRKLHILGELEYSELLQTYAEDFFMWRSDYFHILESPQAVLQWYQGTGLRPYLKALPPEKHPEFEREILSGIESLFPRLHDGSVVFQFPRLFFIARKKHHCWFILGQTWKSPRVKMRQSRSVWRPRASISCVSSRRNRRKRVLRQCSVRSGWSEKSLLHSCSLLKTGQDISLSRYCFFFTEGRFIHLREQRRTLYSSGKPLPVEWEYAKIIDSYRISSEE